MKSDAERHWDSVVGRLRKVKGFCPPTPEEAKEELAAAAGAEPLSEEEVEAIADAVLSGELTDWAPQLNSSWVEGVDTDEVREEFLQFNRNAGEEDAETDELLDEIRREALGDDAETGKPKSDGLGDPGAGSGGGG